MRLTASATITVAATAVAIALAGCSSADSGKAAAARARAQATPAAQGLYQTLRQASARSVATPDGGYVECGTGKTKLYYSISMRLFSFKRQNSSLSAYRDQVVSLVRRDGWTLRQETPPPFLPPPATYYRLGKRQGKITVPGTLAIFPDTPFGVGGTITVNSPCFDAGGAADSLHPKTSPLTRSTAS